MNKTVLEIKKYELWDVLVNLKDCYEQDKMDFSFTYHNSLAKFIFGVLSVFKSRNDTLLSNLCLS